MRSILLVILLSITACGRSHHKSAPVAQPEVVSILSNWVPTSSVIVIEKLNLSALTLNTIGSSDLVFPCDGNYGNSGLIAGVDQGEVLVSGTEKAGTIQFGHTKYVGATDSECRNVSKESYTYEINNDTLELCMVNWPADLSLPRYCTTYEKSTI
jgi:hypothetical protein